MNQANTPTSTVALVHWKNRLDILKSKENIGLQSLTNAQNIPEFYQASVLLLQTISERIAVGIAAIHLASYRRDDYFLEARKDILNCISMLERVYSHYLDVPFSDYSEMQKQILHIDEMERYKHISQLGFYITLLEHVHPSMDKWQWVFAEIKGRFAIVAKNSIDLSSLHTLLQPGAPHLAERHSYITWVVGLLEKIAEDYRLKYEVVSYNSMDFYRAISYLSGLKRFYLFIGRDNQITEITKKIEIWEAKLLNDERKNPQNDFNIPFSPPDIHESDIAAVVQVLRSGWITTGKKTKQFEQEIASFSQVERVACMSAATHALGIALRMFGVKSGDEVITTPYTYASSANVIVHLGAIPAFVDIDETTFNIDPEAIAKAITTKTKAIIPVDFAGLPANYPKIKEIIEQHAHLFTPEHPLQQALGRPLILADAAHSIGATINNKPAACYADMSVFSFHAVKNVTSAEGGALCLKSLNNISADDLYRQAMLHSLNGQTKDALSKSMGNGWQYDILFPGQKCNMTDIQAALGSSQLSRYPNMIKQRKQTFMYYNMLLKDLPGVILPIGQQNGVESSYHIYPVRFKYMTEDQRNSCINEASKNGISLNVHFQPLPLLTAYKNLGYNMQDYPKAWQAYSAEISLPLHSQLTHMQVERISQFLYSYIKPSGIFLD